MSKSARKRKLDMLKALAAKEKLSQKLSQEKHLNVVQTRMMELELEKFKKQLETLEQKRKLLMNKRDQLEAMVDPELGEDVPEQEDTD